MKPALLAFAAALAAANPAAAQPAPPPADGPQYYAVLFASQTPAGRLRAARTHTWATFVKVTPGPRGAAPALAPVTISWLPADGSIDAARPFRPEPGTNVGLADTFKYVTGQRERVTAFGPFAVDAGRYAAAVDQVARLASGDVSYRAIDKIARRPDASNCIDAVADADPEADGSVPLQCGLTGTRDVANRWVAAGAVPVPPAADWLFPALGVDRYPVALAR